MKHYWLMKSEPESYGIDHLKKDGSTAWEGVRNFQARNFMQAMEVGDEVLFYHSSCAVPGIYGLAKVSAVASPDKTQFDPKSHYFDARAKKEKPIWFCVRVSYVRTFKVPLTLTEMKADKKLNRMKMLEQGSRLSVTPVGDAEFAHIMDRLSESRSGA
jgi:predicted RNA-binding protein with PUA-like domain